MLETRHQANDGREALSMDRGIWFVHVMGIIAPFGVGCMAGNALTLLLSNRNR